jgi:IS5 family transposase
VRLAREIDWGVLDRRFASVWVPGPGEPGPTRLVAGLFILKHMHNLSDEMLRARSLEHPYYQFFCGALASAIDCRLTARHSRTGVLS